MTTHDDLVARYGKPERLPDRVQGLVLAFWHETEESALAYAGATLVRGHIAWTEWPPGGGVISVVDLRPALDRLKAQFADGVGP